MNITMIWAQQEFTYKLPLKRQKMVILGYDLKMSPYL